MKNATTVAEAKAALDEARSLWRDAKDYQALAYSSAYAAYAHTDNENIQAEVADAADGALATVKVALIAYEAAQAAYDAAKGSTK